MNFIQFHIFNQICQSMRLWKLPRTHTCNLNRIYLFFWWRYPISHQNIPPHMISSNFSQYCSFLNLFATCSTVLNYEIYNINLWSVYQYRDTNLWNISKVIHFLSVWWYWFVTDHYCHCFCAQCNLLIKKKM